MNIFVLSKSRKRCAQYHCDKHVIKMILESAQLLYTCIHLTGYSVDNAPYSSSGNRGYRITHKNHPCAVWVRESLSNYIWLCGLAIELCKEYTYRYEKIHKTQEHIEWLSMQRPDIPELGLTEFAKAINKDLYPECHSMDPVTAYRSYYIRDKKNLLIYTKREVPYWINNNYLPSI